MTPTPSLEEERQAILSRMQASREQYRRMLMNDPHPRSVAQPAQAGHPQGNGAAGGPHDPATRPHRYSHASLQSGATPAEAALAWAKQHPLLCAAAVAAVVAIGPRRVLRNVGAALTGGGALTALTLRNPSNIDALARLISTVGTYLQQQPGGKRPPYRP